jgi:alkylation response protein AidB-like acyl-CoA dehydrogenase
MKQQALAGLGKYKKTTRRAQFLAEMDRGPLRRLRTSACSSSAAMATWRSSRSRACTRTRAQKIYGGANEVMKELIARRLFA